MATVSAKIEGELEEDFDEYQDDYGGNKSEAVRSLLRAGLDAKRYPSSLENNLLNAAIQLGVLAVGVVLVEPATPLFTAQGAHVSAASMLAIAATLSGIVKTGLATRIRGLQSPKWIGLQSDEVGR